MITRITTVEELKRIFTETVLNTTNKVTKISDGSVLNGVAYGAAKLGQKTLKDIAVIEAHLFPDSASGVYLDEIAKLQGVAPRFGETTSSTYVRVVAIPGTTYDPTIHTFRGSGINFIPESISVVPSEGFTYVKVRSVTSGLDSNVSALTIDRVSPIPSGHTYTINEFSATGGRDNEGDDLFRERIKDEINVLARGTVAYLEQVFRKINNDVLRVFNLGLDTSGDIQIGVSSVNGALFSDGELSQILDRGESYLSLNELKPDGLERYGVKIVNITYFPIDISVRLDLDSSFNSDRIRTEIQVAINKVVDYRLWENGGIIDWVDLLNAVRGVNGVRRVLDNLFFPNNDIIIPRGQLPRFRGFLMMNLAGEILVNQSGTLNPVFYPNESDFSFQSTVLKSIE